MRDLFGRTIHKDHRATTQLLDGQKKQRAYPEFKIHCQIAAYCAQFLIEGKSMWHTTENSNGRGGNAGQRQQAKLKLMGVQSGFPDGIIFYENKILCIEIKAPKGTIKPHQAEMHKKLQNLGFSTEVVYSFDEFKTVIKKYNIPNREHVGCI